MNKRHAQTVLSERVEPHSAFNFWLADDEHPGVFITGVISVEDAKQSLIAKFGDRVTRVQRIGSEGLAE